MKKNSFINHSLSKKVINSFNLSNLQKNNSSATISKSKNTNASKIHYSNTYKQNNRKIQKYPIKLKYLNDTNLFINNKINITETSINKYKKRNNLNLYKNEENKNINIILPSKTNKNKINKINKKGGKNNKIYKVNTTNKMYRKNISSLSVEKSNNKSQNNDNNLNLKHDKNKNTKDKNKDMKSIIKCKNNLN